MLEGVRKPPALEALGAGVADTRSTAESFRGRGKTPETSPSIVEMFLRHSGNFIFRDFWTLKFSISSPMMVRGRVSFWPMVSGREISVRYLERALHSNAPSASCRAPILKILEVLKS